MRQPAAIMTLLFCLGVASSVSAQSQITTGVIDGSIVDTSGETVVLVGLPPGPHTVRLELADATHKPFPGASKVVEFTIPERK